MIAQQEDYMQNGLTFILAVKIVRITAKNTTNGKITEKKRTVSRMVDIDKVIKAWEIFRDSNPYQICEGIEFRAISEPEYCMSQMIADTLELLKEYEVLKDQNAKLIRQKEARFQQKWIPVEEELPKYVNNKVLVYLEHDDLNGYIGYGHFEKWKGDEIWFDLEHTEPFSDRGWRVTHWMELPEKPGDV